MRKVDYSFLAAVIRDNLQTTAEKHGITNAERESARQTAMTIARNFADRASVDRAAFLRACGIE